MSTKKLIVLRKSLNLSIAAMAEKIGVSKSYYEKIEYGDRTPSFNFLTKFKQVFPNVETDSMFFGNENTNCVN